jgi:hypothetical protein
MNADETIARRLMRLAPVKFEKAVDRLNHGERETVTRALEAIADRAAWLARYLDERAGYGCGDQGHAAGVKSANRVGTLLWVKGFGYGAYHNLTI